MAEVLPVGAWRGLQRGHQQQVQFVKLGGSGRPLLLWRRIGAPDLALVADLSKSRVGSKGGPTIRLVAAPAPWSTRHCTTWEWEPVTAAALALVAVIGAGSGPALAVPVTTDPGGGGGDIENLPACLSNATGSIHASLSSMMTGQSVEVDWSSQVPSGCTVARTITGPGFDSQTLAGSGSRVVNPTSAGTATWTLWLWYASGGVDCSASMGSVSVTVESVPQEGLPVLQNTGNGKCLQPENESLFQGAAIVQEPCNGSDAQRWYPNYPNPVNGNYVEGFQNRHSLLCLDARGGATNGTPIQQWTCNSISNEKWLAGLPPRIVQVLSRVSGTATHCLDNPNQSTENGTAMQLFACNGTAAQRWFFGPSSV